MLLLVGSGSASITLITLVKLELYKSKRVEKQNKRNEKSIP